MKEMKIERKEKWVQINKIEGYEDIKDQYWISNSDEDVIINKDTRKQLKPWFDKDGYSIVGLMTNQGKIRCCKIHIIKAKAFIFGPIPLGYNVVRHLNDVKTDNRLINLAWGTQSDNMRDCVKNGNFNYEASAKNGKISGKKTGAKNGKRTSKPVRCIETNIIYLSTHEASRKLGIRQSSISLCCNGKCKTAGGFHFEFVNKEVNNNELECEQIR